MNNQDHSITEERTTSISMTRQSGDILVTATATGPSITPSQIADTALNALVLAEATVAQLNYAVKHAKFGNVTVLTNVEPAPAEFACSNFDLTERTA